MFQNYFVTKGRCCGTTFTSLPILACSIIREDLIVSFLAFVESSFNPLLRHSRTVLGIIRFNDFPSASTSVALSMVFMDEARVSVSLGMTLNKRNIKEC